MQIVQLWFAILAFVLTAAALASGIVDQAPFSLSIVFLFVGLALGPRALGLADLGPRNNAVVAVATVNLALVLFLDAARFDVDELRREWRVPLLDLGPGTLLTVGGIAIAALLVLHLSVLDAVILGAVLASTDPIVLRDVVRDERVPRSVRRALVIEAGTNDIIVLPIVLVAIQIALASAAGGQGHGAGYWAAFLVELLFLSPLSGLVVGGVGAWIMGKADARYNIRREYQALYGIGLVLAAYSIAQALGGDGFIASFFAGVAVAVFDVTLCDCFMDYGEVTAEAAMMLAFILFGAVLNPLFASIAWPIMLLFALLVIFAVRPAAVVVSLLRARMSWLARGFIAWFGPRGLSALLLALLVVESETPNAMHLFAITGAVVLVSVIVHGVSATPAANWYAARVAQGATVAAEERESVAAGLFAGEASNVPRVSVPELQTLLASANPPLVLDVRAHVGEAKSDALVPGSLRMPPDHVYEWAKQTLKADPAARTRPIITYCT